MSSPVVSNRTPTGQIIQSDGTATFAFLKWMQNIGATVNISFDSEGNYQGAIGDQATIDGRATLASIVQYIDTGGVVTGPGIDFARNYLNKDTDHIADGSGSPLAGGKEAYAVLVASGPAVGQTIRFNGSDWQPVAIAVAKVFATKRWINSYDAATGQFATSQPVFTDIAGQISDVLILTTTGTSGASTLLGNTLNIPNYTAPAQVYPASGIAVSTGIAWSASINPADVARVGSNNNFTASQTITGNLTASGNFVAHTGTGYLSPSTTPAALVTVYGVATLVSGSATVTFATPFGAGQVYVYLTVIAGGTPAGSLVPTVWISSATSTGIIINASSATATNPIFWMAVGNP